ncbi:MAG: M48 family metalloprotease [Magnetovibrio sp.]|nr:M48 family metalloprotease [Magnetovibrio sp.]
MKNHINLIGRLVVATLVLGACSSNLATGKQSFTGFMSAQKELQVGAEEHPKILQQFGGGFEDRKVATYVRNLGLQLAKTSEMPDLPWTFTVLNDPMVNAFALPGGYIYVTRGLLALASDKAELAGVLSHEIGHVTARHTAQRYSSTMIANIGVQVMGVLSQVAGLGRVGGDLASLGANMALKSYSRDQELESDMLGARYMVNLGYDSSALISFFEKLRAHQTLEAKKAGKDTAAVDQTSIFATHPRTADRITQAINLAKTKGKGASRRDADEYLNVINGMVFGEGAKEGRVQGKVFIHAALKVRFEVPEQFTLNNTSKAVLASDGQGATIEFSMAAAKDVHDAGGMKKFLVEKWASSLSQKNIEWLNINGLRAITGEGIVWTRGANVIVRRILVERDKNTYWQLKFEIPTKRQSALNEPLRTTTYSLREPTANELASAQSLRVRVVTIGPNVTYDDLVKSMAVDNLKAEWFMALNNLKPADPLPIGRRIKIIK